MKTFRPCLRCGRDDPPDAETCSACGTPLQAWASQTELRPVRAAGLSSRARRLLLGFAGLALLLAVGRILLGTGEVAPEMQGPSWREPETVAAWAGEWFARRDLPPERILALVERRTSRPRRLLLTAHGSELEIEPLVRAAAGVLLAAREGGERLLIHAALLEHGPEGDRRTLLLPASDAARVLNDEAALISLLDSVRRGSLSELAGLSVVPAAEPAVAMPGSEPGQADESADADGADDSDDGVAEDGALDESPGDAHETPDAAASAGPTPGAEGVHVGLGSGPGAGVTPPTSSTEASEPAAPARKPLPVSLLKGPGKRLKHSYEAGEQQVVLLRAMLHPRSKRPLILRSLTVQPHGELNDAEGIDFVYLIHDRDRNGRRDPKDEQIGDVVAFVADDAPAVFEDLDFSFGADGGLLHLLLVVDFLDHHEGGSVMLMIPARDGLVIEEVSTGARVRVDGAPLNGTMTKLNGDVEPDPLQEKDRPAAGE